MNLYLIILHDQQFHFSLKHFRQYYSLYFFFFKDIIIYIPNFELLMKIEFYIIILVAFIVHTPLNKSCFF